MAQTKSATVDKPLNSPVHSNIANNERRSEVKNLMAESSPGVENSCVECTGERTLSVGAQAVVDYASLCLRPCVDRTSAPVPSLRVNNNSNSIPPANSLPCLV